MCIKLNMKMLALIVNILLVTSFTAIAQQAPVVKGQVNQAGNKPVELATVTLLKAKDSSLVKGTIADINGKYEFEQVKQGKYLIAAVAMGMNKSYGPAFEVKEANVTLPVIMLAAVSKALKGVDVTARKPFIEQKAEKMVVNVESSITTSGGSAMEVLEKSPTITVDKDGNISMKGKGGVVIMIDGKPTNMSSQDVVELLKSMPASNLEQIELIANPSAKYDAAGNAGIINLKLKKNINFGTNGNFTLGGAYGIRPRWNTGVNLNHRNANFNMYGSYNYSNRDQQQYLGLYRTVPENGFTNIYDQTNSQRNKSRYQGGKIGVDYFINKNNTIGVMADIAMRNQDRFSYATTHVGRVGQLDSILNTNSLMYNKWKRGAYNLNYRGILDSTGKELNVDLDYARNTNRQYANITALSIDGIGKAFLSSDTSRSNQPSNIEIKTAKIDYVQPLSNLGKMEIGAKVSFVTTDNNARFDSLRGGSWLADENRSNHFIYKENINAAYINFNKQYKQLFVQVGLRGEQTHISGNSTFTKDQQQQKSNNDSTYFNLFPSAALTYKLNKNNTLGFTYSHRIQRPSYEDLNPFEFYLDRYTKAAGNPYLRPQYSNNFEITNTFKEFLVTSFGYAHTKDMMTKILEADVDPSTGDTSIVRHKYLNVASADNFNLSISAPVPITKWWMSFSTLTVAYGKYSTVVNNNPMDLSSAAFFGRTQQTFTLTKDLSAEATFFYSSPQVTEEGLWKMKSMCSLDLGVQQKVLKGKGAVKLNISDVFKTNYFRGTFENGDRYSSVSSKWDAQQIRLTFNYRFGNADIKAARKRTSGLEDEQNRVKSGN
ncbi:TonB-dependent receptor domain-containing protein [Chitinophaga sp. 30R24]|uniref:TonB-dependent receptor domain-containing protein n=1 Tax=Chitinophaga sp. 30R24 TaxID=3248838 RepID=UPI003B90C377